MLAQFLQVLFGSDHPWDPAMYSGGELAGPDLQCELMKSVCVQVNALCTDTRIARLTGSRAIVHTALADKALLNSHWSRLYWQLGKPGACSPHWLEAHHPEALTQEHQASLMLQQLCCVAEASTLMISAIARLYTAHRA